VAAKVGVKDDTEYLKLDTGCHLKLWSNFLISRFLFPVTHFPLFLVKCLMVNKKLIPYLVILVLAIALFFVKRCRQDDAIKIHVKNDNGSSPVNRNRGFDRRISYLEYSEHAKCRMRCRNITQAEVEKIMKDGKINYAKSDVNDRPCPTYALEGITDDHQRVRIVFAQCDHKTKVVTSIDLNTDWECNCPGDEGSTSSPNKKKN